MMEVKQLLSPQEWAEQTFGGVQLGHVARRRRAVTIAAAMAREPGGSFPAQQQRNARPAGGIQGDVKALFRTDPAQGNGKSALGMACLEGSHSDAVFNIRQQQGARGASASLRARDAVQIRVRPL